jgi:hypothetical protein
LRRVPAPREQRHLAWQLLHGALPCAARQACFAARAGQPAVSPVCPRSVCAHAGAADTLTHAFLECPAAAAVAGWVSDLWAAVTGGPGPPCQPAVFLAADHRAWDPGDGPLGELWHVLRLAHLWFVWAARARSHEDVAVQPAGVAAQIVHFLRRRMRQDATRVLSRAVAYAGVSEQWLPSADRPRLSESEFVERWAHRGVLCSWGPHGPVIHLTVGHPVPLPPPM